MKTPSPSAKLSTLLRELHPQAAEFFKDIYSLKFLDLPAEHYLRLNRYSGTFPTRTLKC